jgi:hypothetical protein
VAKKVEGKTLAIGFLAVLFGLAGVVFWIGATGGSRHVPRSAPGVGFTVPSAKAPDAGAAHPHPLPPPPPPRPVPPG